jgi:membrane protein
LLPLYRLIEFTHDEGNMIAKGLVLLRLRIPMNFLAFVWRNFMRNEGLENAKSLTFTSLFAVVPLLTLILSILSAFPSFQVFGAQVQEMIYQRLLPSTGSELQDYFNNFAGQARNLTWAGAAMLLGTAYLMLVNIERNFNRIWGVSEQRKGLTSFMLYWSVLSLGPLLLGMGFAISSYITSLALFDRFTEFQLVGGHDLLLGLFPVLLTTIAFTLLYVAVPNCGVKLRHGFLGALAVALAFIVVKWLFSVFIATASYAFIYGTFAAIPAFLIWLYICWVVILFGANFVRAIPLYGSRVGSEEVHPSLLLLALLHKFWEKQQTGSVLHVTELLAEKWPFRSVTPDQLLSLLEGKHLVHALGDDEYLLARDLEVLSVWDVLGDTPWGLPAADELTRPLPAVVAEHVPELADLYERFRHINELAEKEFSSSLGAWFRRSV